ncbi:MAG: TonB-dependent receptor [Dysgonamonadaceae bacterium]|nr:TonB-dependent receptor [Dysgonamonadaceae bacterium]
MNNYQPFRSVAQGHRKDFLRTLFIFTLFISAFAVSANEVDSLRHVSLDSIIVSGVKYTNNHLELPVSATSVSQGDMQSAQLNTIKDFSAFVPNFIMIDRDTRLTSSVFVRGIGSLVNIPGVAMYVDGIPHFEKSSFDINLADVEKVEFLRGPQGTLYGRNAMGGIILVHTKSPLKYQGSKVNLRLGSYEDYSALFSRSEKINEKLGYTVSADYNHYGGFIKNEHTGKKADALDNASLNTRLEWRPQVNLNFRLTNNFEYADQGAFAYGDVNEDKNWVEKVSLDHESKYRRKLYDGGLRVDYHNDLLWLYALTSVQWLDDRYDVDQDASSEDKYYAIQSETQRLVSQEINLKNLYSDVYSWHFGFFAFNHDIDRSTDVMMNMANPPYKLEKRYDDYNRGIAAYHQSTLKLGRRFTLEAGIRYDLERANSVYHEQKITNGTPAPVGDFDAPMTFSQWTPKASLQYHFRRNGQFYANVSKGYKTGGFNTVFDSEENLSFGPESSWNYEIGGKSSFFENRLHAEFALFYINLENQQIRQLLPETGIRVLNAGKSANKGLEITVLANPWKSLRLTAAYGYTHAKFKEYSLYNSSTQSNDDYAGKFTPFVPRNTVSLGAQYDFFFRRDTAIEKISLACNYKGLGTMYWNEKNDVRQPFYGLLNAQVSAVKKKVEVSLWGRNLMDAKYLGYYFEVSGRKLGKPGKPLSLGGSLTYWF